MVDGLGSRKITGCTNERSNKPCQYMGAEQYTQALRPHAAAHAW